MSHNIYPDPVIEVRQRLADSLFCLMILILHIFLTHSLICYISELNDISKSVSHIHYQDPVIKVRQRLVNSSYDLMIFSYMRSGSTMTGEVFAENRDFFFVFEPLLSIVPYQYLTTTDVCNMRNTECRYEIVFLSPFQYSKIV